MRMGSNLQLDNYILNIFRVYIYKMSQCVKKLMSALHIRGNYKETSTNLFGHKKYRKCKRAG